MTGCGEAPPVDTTSFVGILTAELRADGVEQVRVAPTSEESRAPPGLATISVRAASCEGVRRDVVVHIADAATHKSLERTVPMADVAERWRPRALALAVAELLRASWLELCVPDAPPSEVSVPAVVRQAAEGRIDAIAAPRHPEVDWTPPNRRDLSVALAWRAYPTARASLVGGRAAFALPMLSSSWLGRIDAGVVVGSEQDVLGDVTLGEATGGLALLYAAPLNSTLLLAVGPRAEGGAAWASGTPLDQSTSSRVGSGFVASATMLGELRYRFARSWSAALELEAGAVAVPFEALADGRRVTGVDGVVFGLAVGLAQLLR